MAMQRVGRVLRMRTERDGLGSIATVSVHNRGTVPGRRGSAGRLADGMAPPSPSDGEKFVTQPPYGPPPVQEGYAPPPQGQPYYGAPAGQPPYGPPQPAPGKKPFYKRKWFLVLAVIVALSVIGSAINGGNTETAGTGSSAADAPAAGASDAAPEAPAASEPEREMPGIGEPAADGKFSFVVQGVDCSLTEIGNEYFGTKAQGQFCVVNLAVSNIGNEPQSFFGENAKLFNAQGQEYSADNQAAMYLEDSASLYEEINPGNTLRSQLAFDVPTDVTPTTIELHDSNASVGVTVSLR